MATDYSSLTDAEIDEARASYRELGERLKGEIKRFPERPIPTDPLARDALIGSLNDLWRKTDEALSELEDIARTRRNS